MQEKIKKRLSYTVDDYSYKKELEKNRRMMRRNKNFQTVVKTEKTQKREYVCYSDL